MSKGLDYSKWDHIEVSDDEDDTHPNIDTPSLFRWRHQARVDRMEEQKQEKTKLEQESKEYKKKVKEVTEKMKKVEAKESSEDDAKKLQIKLSELKKQEEEFKKKEAELAKKERLTPWNVDTLSKDGFEKTIINKPKKKEDMSEEDKHKQMLSFIEKYEKEIKQFGMVQNHDTSAEYLRDRPHLVRTDTANYLTMWCVNLEVQSKSSLMKTVAHQTIVMQYILELASQLDRDPRSCVPGFFKRIKSAEKQYVDAFDDELQSFIKRVQTRARARIEEAMKEHEEEERQKRLGPGGLDPLEVMETLPSALRECFETKNVPMLQTALDSLSKEERAYHWQRCIASGLWVADAEAAGLTPASEELQKMAAEQDEDEDSDEHYESLDDQEDDKNKDGEDDSREEDKDLDLD